MAKYLIAAVSGLLLVSYIQAGPIPEEFKEVAPTIRAECMKESGVALELLERANNGDFADDQTLKCYMKCVFDQFRLVSKEGVNFKIFLKLAPPSYQDVVKEVLAECSDIKAGNEGDLCDLVYEVNKCMLRVGGDRYFFM